jgi:hypothetical protein
MNIQAALRHSHHRGSPKLPQLVQEVSLLLGSTHLHLPSSDGGADIARVDNACIRDLGSIVTDGHTYFSEEQRDTRSEDGPSLPLDRRLP